MTTKTAVSYLKTFFSKVNGDFASLDNIYTASGLDLNNIKKNRVWLGNKLLYMKRLNLVKPVYKGIPLIGLKLTEDGKRALGAGGERYIIENDSTSLEDVMKAVAKLKKQHPEFEITFNVKLVDKE